MIPDVDGMVAADVVVLLFYSEHRWRIVAPPATVSANTPLSQTHANRRIKKLSGAGLLELVDDRGYYRVTSLGERFIMGQATPDEIGEIPE